MFISIVGYALMWNTFVIFVLYKKLGLYYGDNNYKVTGKETANWMVNEIIIKFLWKLIYISSPIGRSRLKKITNSLHSYFLIE